MVSGQELTTTNITIDNNNFSGAGGNGVISLDTNDTSTIKGTANNNIITNPPIRWMKSRITRRKPTLLRGGELPRWWPRLRWHSC